MIAYIYLNCMSGQGLAERYYKTNLRPFLELNFNLKRVVYLPCECDDYMIDNEDNNEKNTIFIIGGDGTVSLTIFKIMENSNFHELKIPIYICPFGSGNGLAKNLNIDPYKLNLNNKKYIRPLVFDYNGKNTFSFLAQTWGIISDIDINTENLRYLGDLRYYYGILTSIFFPKYYEGECCITNLKDNTLNIKDSFLFFCGSNAPWISKDFNIAPLSDLFKKEIDILIIKEELSFFQRLKLVYYLATDSIHKFPFIEYFKAKKYKLSIDNFDSFLVSDGEKLLATNIEVNLSDHKFLFYCN